MQSGLRSREEKIATSEIPSLDEPGLSLSLFEIISFADDTESELKNS